MPLKGRQYKQNVVYMYVGEEEIPPPQSTCGWTNNKIDTRQINRRKRKFFIQGAQRSDGNGT